MERPKYGGCTVNHFERFQKTCRQTPEVQGGGLHEPENIWLPASTTIPLICRRQKGRIKVNQGKKTLRQMDSSRAAQWPDQVLEEFHPAQWQPIKSTCCQSELVSTLSASHLLYRVAARCCCKQIFLELLYMYNMATYYQPYVDTNGAYSKHEIYYKATLCQISIPTIPHGARIARARQHARTLIHTHTHTHMHAHVHAHAHAHAHTHTHDSRDIMIIIM